MTPFARSTFAERTGRTLGRLWQGCECLDRKANGWLVAQGWTPGVAKAALLIIKLGVLLYAAFWLALLLTFAVVAAWAARSAEWDTEEMSQTEWRYGPAGYGLYTSNGHRIDPHDPEDEKN